MLYTSNTFTDPYEMFAIDNITAEVHNVKPLIVDMPTITVVVLVCAPFFCDFSHFGTTIKMSFAQQSTCNNKIKKAQKAI